MAGRLKNVALVTWSGLPQLAADDLLLRTALECRGVNVSAVSWDDPAVAWEAFDVVVLRSTWNYHQQPVRFASWLDHLESSAVEVWNPVPILRRNIHKGYLLDLEAAGIAIVPTALIAAGTAVPIAEVMASRGWSRAVVKPAVSASGFQTFVAKAGTDAVSGELDLLVQPFVDEVVAAGEWSFMFIAGTYSHAAMKRPGRGDFRVQESFGGTTDAASPPARLIDQARAIVLTIEGPWLYARVDAVEMGGQLILMELEMTEPSLFFELHPEAAERMADAIVAIRASVRR